MQAGETGGLTVPVTLMLVALTHADESSFSGGTGLKSTSVISMLSQGALELQFSMIGILEMVVPFMFLKWTSLILTLDCCTQAQAQMQD